MQASNVGSAVFGLLRDPDLAVDAQTVRQGVSLGAGRGPVLPPDTEVTRP